MKACGVFSRFPRVCLAFILGFCAFRLLAEEPATETNRLEATIVNVRVTNPTDAVTNFFHNSGWFSDPSVEVDFLLTPPEGRLIDDEGWFNTELTSFTDDQGTNLLAVESKDAANRDRFHFTPSAPPFQIMAYKKEFIMVRATAPHPPTRGATFLNVSGRVFMYTASGQKQFTAENLEMSTNTTFNLGDLSVSILSTQTNRTIWAAQGYKYQISLYSTRNLMCLASVNFYDEAGNAVGLHSDGWGPWRQGYYRQFDIMELPKRFKIVANCWQDYKKVVVPVSLKTGVGL